MSFDEIFDLTAGVYFISYNIYTYETYGYGYIIKNENTLQL